MKEDSERQLNSRELQEKENWEKEVKQLNNQIFQLQTLIYKKNETIRQIQEEKNYTNIDDYLETIKLFKYVTEYCKEKEFYYEKEGTTRIESEVLIRDISNLIEILKKSFKCLNKTPQKINMLGERTPSGGNTKIIHKETPAIKNLHDEADFKLPNILKKNFTFEVPEISMELDDKQHNAKPNELESIKEDVSPKTPESSRKTSKQKTIYICSLEQQLSSDKKSYKIERTGDNQEIVILENNEKPEIENKKAIYQNLFYKCSKQTIENTSESNVNESEFEWTYDKNYKSLRTSELDQTESEKCEEKMSQKFELKNSTLMQIESRRFIENCQIGRNSLLHVEENNLLSKKDCEEVVEENQTEKEYFGKNEQKFQLKIKKEPIENFSFNYNQPEFSKESKFDESFVNIAKTTQNSKNNIFKENSNGFKNTSFQTDCPSDKDIVSEENFSRNYQKQMSIESNYLKNSESLKIRSNNQYFLKKKKKYEIENVNIYPPKKPVSKQSELTLESTFNYQRKCINSMFNIESPMTIWYKPKRAKIRKTLSTQQNIQSKNSLSSILNTSYSISSKLNKLISTNNSQSTNKYHNERKKHKKSKSKSNSRIIRQHMNKSFNESSIENETSLYSKYMKIFQKSNLTYQAKTNYRRRIQNLKNKMRIKSPNEILRHGKVSSRAINTGFRKLKEYKRSLINNGYKTYRVRKKSSKVDGQFMYSSKYDNNVRNNENYILN